MQHSAYSCSRNTALRVELYPYLGAIAKLVRGQVDLAEAALPDQLSQRVVADALEVGGGEFTARSVSMAHAPQEQAVREVLTREAACTRRRAACGRQSVSQSARSAGSPLGPPPAQPTSTSTSTSTRGRGTWPWGTARAATHCYCYGYGYGYYAPSFSVQPVQRSPGDS